MSVISFLGSLNHATCKWDVFLNGHFVVEPPNITRVTEPTSKRMDIGHCGTDLKMREIGFGRENLVVTSFEVGENARRRIGGCKMMKGAAETIGGRYCKLFHPLYDHHFSAADTDAPSEYVETMTNEGGMKVGKLWHRHEVFECREENGVIQRCLKDPRDAPQVHRDCLLAWMKDSKGGDGGERAICCPVAAYQLPV